MPTPGSDPGMVTHAHPDDRYLGNILVAGNIQICPLFFHPLQDTNSRLTIQSGNGEAQVGQARVGGAALNDYIYHDAFLGNFGEYPGGNTGYIR